MGTLHYSSMTLCLQSCWAQYHNTSQDMPFGELLTVLGYIEQIGFVVTLPQLLCELRLQLKLGSGCSLVESGRLHVQQAAV